MLGGSFNPPHGGHREISLLALDRLALDTVWWLVTPGNPLKDKSIYAPYNERLKAARKFANHPDIVISDFESRQNTQYTVDTLERLKLLNPEISYVWLMGADSFVNFHKWKDWRRVSELAPMAIFNRPGYEQDALASDASKALGKMRLDEDCAHSLADAVPPAWIFFSEPDNPMSSTALRK